MANNQLAVDTDTTIAALYREKMNTRERLGLYYNTLQHLAGAKWYYRGRRRVTDMKIDEAREIVVDEIAKLQAHGEANKGESGRWISYEGIVQPRDLDHAVKTIAKIDELLAKIEDLDEQMAPLEAVYAENRWSRFFLVTSSPGHIHSSMYCSTCRFTTTYGWLPQLSGESEETAVAEHGPALCSVCFPSAPVAWQGGKITKATASAAAV